MLKEYIERETPDSVPVGVVVAKGTDLEIDQKGEDTDNI